MAQPRFLQLTPTADGDSAVEAATGLLRSPATLPPKFFYDAQGSRLFDAITELPEYYPTRTEAAIFAQHGPDIAQAALAHFGLKPEDVLNELARREGLSGLTEFAQRGSKP